MATGKKLKRVRHHEIWESVKHGRRCKVLSVHTWSGGGRVDSIHHDAVTYEYMSPIKSRSGRRMKTVYSSQELFVKNFRKIK